MTHDAEPHTHTLWTRAASLLAAFVRAYMPAMRFAKMKESPAVLVADALTRLRRIEALVRRVLFAQALGVRVALKPATPRKTITARTPARAAPLDGDPSTWRVRFSVPLPQVPHPRRPRALRERTVRHPILLRPDRLPRLPGPHRPYDPVAAARWRARAKARAEAAYRAFWYAPWPPPPVTGPMFVELPISNEPVDMLSTLAIARRMEALNRVIADPAPYVRRLAVRLARTPSRAPRVLAHWQARTRRVLEGDETLRLATDNHRRRADDTS